MGDNNIRRQPGEWAVTAEELTRRFGTFVAVNKVSFQVRPGEIFGFLGPNGAGKSTTIRMLCGILSPTGGRAVVAGYDVAREPEMVKQHIGYMSQRFSLYPDLTVMENIAFYSGIYHLSAQEKKERQEWVLSMAGLESHRHTLTAQLAGGWQQRLALGCALLHRPPVLFLDEPTSGVDPIARRQFWDLIYTLADDGVTVFVTTHYMDEAEYCHRLALIYRGEMVALGTPAELKARHVPGDVLSVDCAAPYAALGAVEKLPGVREAALFGRGLHVVVTDAREAAPRLTAALADAGLTGSVAPVPPSLEDVFVAVIEARDQQDNPGAAGVAS